MPSYDRGNRSEINNAISLKKDIVSVFKNYMKVKNKKTSSILHHMNILNKMLNSKHEKLLLYL